MSDAFERAREMEEHEDFVTASKLYFESGISNLNDVEFEPNRKYRVGVATLLRSVSCAARADEMRRATGIKRIAAGAIEQMVAADPDACLSGLCREWLGDLHLITDSAAATDHYRKAAQYYQDCSDGMQATWGMEEEFDYALWAVEAFLETEEYDLPEGLPELDFEARIRRKIDLSERRS